MTNETFDYIDLYSNVHSALIDDGHDGVTDVDSFEDVPNIEDGTSDTHFVGIESNIGDVRNQCAYIYVYRKGVHTPAIIRGINRSKAELVDAYAQEKHDERNVLVLRVE